MSSPTLFIACVVAVIVSATLSLTLLAGEGIAANALMGLGVGIVCGVLAIVWDDRR